jgi:predicted RNA binding protein YcfA (HicA-like mRNA interferase family)
MSEWPSIRAPRVLAALLKIGWTVKRQSGSHRTLSRDGWPDFVFAFHEGEESGPGCWHGSRSAQASDPATSE